MAVVFIEERLHSESRSVNSSRSQATRAILQAVADWNDFRYFLALAREGTLAGAARALGVDATTVSRRIAALEAALATKLFIRTPDGFVLTAAGMDGHALVERGAHELEAVELRVAGEDAKLRGTVRLTTPFAFTQYLVPRLVELGARHPEIVIELLASDAVLDLGRREADLAVRLVATQQGDLLSRKIGEVGWTLCASDAYLARAGTPGSATELAGHDLIGFDDERAFLAGAQWIAAHGAGARIVMRCNSGIAVVSAATMGTGLAFVPAYLIANEPSLRRIGAPFLYRDIWLVVHPDLAGVARIRAVMDFIIEVVRRDTAVLRGRDDRG
jgi:DNA-binding transcriptional LysR family regulator